MRLLYKLFRIGKDQSGDRVRDYDLDKQLDAVRDAKAQRAMAQRRTCDFTKIDTAGIIKQFAEKDRLAKASREKNHFAETIMLALSGDAPNEYRRD